MKTKQFPAVTQALLSAPKHNLGSIAGAYNSNCAGTIPPHAQLCHVVLCEMDIWSDQGGYDVALSLSLDGCDVKELP